MTYIKKLILSYQQEKASMKEDRKTSISIMGVSIEIQLPQICFGYRYPEIGLDKAKMFMMSLCHICLKTHGSSIYEELYEYIHSFISEETGSVQLMRDAGLDATDEKRNTIDILSDYCAELSCCIQSQDIGIFGEKVHWYFDRLQREMSTNNEQTAYFLTSYSDVVKYLFLNNAHEYIIKVDMLLGCLLNNDISKAHELLEMFIETTEYTNYFEPNGWEHEYGISIKTLLHRVYRIINSDNTFDETTTYRLVDNAVQIAIKSMDYLSDGYKNEIQAELQMIEDSL